MTAPRPELKYKRLLLKLSGEALMGKQSYGIDMSVADRLANDIAETVAAGAEIAIVVGGGNIFRGLTGAAKGMDRATADYMGMLATVMNALAFQNALDHRGVAARVLSAIPMQTICESYVRPKALSYISKGHVVIFAAGTGNPFFTTDTAAVLRGIEMNCDAVVKATQVDGVYSADPKKDSQSEAFRPAQLFASFSERSQGNGRRGHRSCPRQRTSANCGFHRRAGKSLEGRAWTSTSDHHRGNRLKTAVAFEPPPRTVAGADQRIARWEDEKCLWRPTTSKRSKSACAHRSML